MYLLLSRYSLAEYRGISRGEYRPTTGEYRVPTREYRGIQHENTGWAQRIPACRENTAGVPNPGFPNQSLSLPFTENHSPPSPQTPSRVAPIPVSKLVGTLRGRLSGSCMSKGVSGGSGLDLGCRLETQRWYGLPPRGATRAGDGSATSNTRAPSGAAEGGWEDGGHLANPLHRSRLNRHRRSGHLHRGCPPAQRGRWCQAACQLLPPR